jgi:endo-beta-N-acetylglucosaminidase D
MGTKRVILILLLTSTAALIQGCVVFAAGAGAGTAAYMMGDLEAVESKDIHSVYAATEKAAEQLELKLIQKSKDAMTGIVVLRDAQDKKITIKLKTIGEGATKISIRVGILGDESKSRFVYQKIQENLKEKTK